MFKMHALINVLFYIIGNNFIVSVTKIQNIQNIK